MCLHQFLNYAWEVLQTVGEQGGIKFVHQAIFFRFTQLSTDMILGFMTETLEESLHVSLQALHALFLPSCHIEYSLKNS